MTSSSPEPDLPTPLGGTVVVDLTGSVAGQYAGRVLAMYGADVVLVEPPSGTPTRTMPPAPYLFRHLNQGKRSVLADPEVVAALCARADVVLRDVSYELPTALADSLVECVVGDFPDGSPYAGWRGGELVQQALSGVMNATGSAVRQPVYGVGQRSSYATGSTAYISILAALHERERSGRGQRVWATAYESAAAMGQNLVSQFSYNGTAETRAKYPGFLAILRCRDAWMVLFAIRNWPALCRVFGLEDLLDDLRFATSGDRLANWMVVTERLQASAAGMLADDAVAACQAGRISAEKVLSLAELVDSEHWRLREVLRPVGDSQVALHRLFTISGTATGVSAPSPGLGADQPAGSAR